jgi:hypothetical protein
LGTHVQFEDSRDHDHGLRPVTVLEHRKLQCVSTVDEETTPKAALVLDDPTAVTVFADKKER